MQTIQVSMTNLFWKLHVNEFKQQQGFHPIYYWLAKKFFSSTKNDLIDSQGFYFTLGVQEGVFDR